MRGIFISYRRDDSEGYVGRLYEALVAHFGRDAVFMDVAAIKAGRDFRRVIEQQVAACGVLLVVIGRDWLDARNDAGERRLELPADPVRIEVAAALRREIPVIPVLVQGASMPPPDRLPADLSDLAYRNAVELRHPRWTSDVAVLIEGLAGDLGASPGTAASAGVENGRDDGRAARGESPRQTSPEAGPQPVADNPASRSSESRARGAFPARLLAAVITVGAAGGSYYLWHQHNAEREAAERQAAIESAAAAKAEADRIAAQRAQEEEAARAESARLAAEKAAAAAAETEKAQREAAAARAEAERLAADLRKQKDASEAARAQAAAARAAAEARERQAAEEARRLEAAQAEARRKSAEAQRQPPGSDPPAQEAALTPWLPLREFFSLRKSQPKGEDFPYSFQASCAPNESFRVRGRFGAFPAGVKRPNFGVFTAERYQEVSTTRNAEGHKLYSRQSVSCPAAGGGSGRTIYVAAVWVQ